MAHSASLIRVAVVEDRTPDLENLRTLLANQPGFECVAACRSAEEAVSELPRHQIDVVLMDIHLPSKSGIDCVRTLVPLLPRAQFMMLTVIEDHDAIYASLEAGATGYLLKKTPGPKILEAIAELHAGGAPMSGQIARKVISAFRPLRKPSAITPTKPPVSGPFDPLSPSEEDVLNRLARGLLYKEVAAELNISISTVRTHVWHIYRKLQAHNRTEAINHSRARQ